MSDAYVRLRAGGEHYALPVGEVLEVVPLGEVERVPGAPAGTLGLTTVRGQPLPVFGLAALLGLPGGEGAAQIVVTEERGRRVGLAVEEVLDVAQLSASATDGISDRLCGSVLVDDALVGILDLAALIAGLEAGVPG